MLNWQWQSFDDLTKTELYEILRLRETVFVLEQECAYQDLDYLDQHAWHACGRNDDGELAAYCRVVYPGKKYQEPAIGRVATAKEFRGLGIGIALMDYAIKQTEHHYEQQGIRISAQQYLEKFYTDLGFVVSSEPYKEDEIPHIEMLRK
ncbi:MAG: ElaA protein [Pseudomonadales bacterium]|jgi:ElaA protein